MIADRYGDVIQNQSEKATAPQARRGSVEELPDADAVRYVGCLVDIRRRLYTTHVSQEDGASQQVVRAALERSFREGLADNGIDRVAYQEIESVFRAWQEGSSEVPTAYRLELDRQRDALGGLEIEGYDPLGR
jgi:hypothetical protein